MKLPYSGLYNPFLTHLNGRFSNHTTRPRSPIRESRFQFNKPAPQFLKGRQWQIHPFQKENAAATYDAYLRNPHALVQQHQESCRVEPYTWQDHLRQIEHLEQERLSGERFSFAVLNGVENKCLGGVTILPLRPFLHYHNAPNRLMIRADENVAMITCWMCQSCPDSNFSKQVIAALHHWFTTNWELNDHFFRTNPCEPASMDVMEQAGLRIHFCLETTSSPHPYIFYGA